MWKKKLKRRSASDRVRIFFLPCGVPPSDIGLSQCAALGPRLHTAALLSGQVCARGPFASVSLLKEMVVSKLEAETGILQLVTETYLLQVQVPRVLWSATHWNSRLV